MAHSFIPKSITAQHSSVYTHFSPLILSPVRQSNVGLEVNMHCMIISQHSTFHARLAVKGPDIYLSFQSQLFFFLLLSQFLVAFFFFWNESIYVPGVSQGEQTFKHKTPLIYIRLSLGPWICLSHKAAAVCFATSREMMCCSALNQPPEKQLDGGDGSKTRLLTFQFFTGCSRPCCTLCSSCFSLFAGKCTDNRRLD